MASQQHLDRLSAVDAGFLAQEKPNTHMHIGGLALFEGEAPGFDEFLAHIESRLHLVPRYRQKLAVPPLETGRPLWVDDPTFNLAYHVRHTALPEPGDEDALLAMAARVFSQRLDRSKPLWELWLVERRSGDGWALLSKTHHALVDGVSGVDLASVLFDVSPAETPSAGAEPWVPQPEPSGAELAARGISGAVRAVNEVATGAIGEVA
jgi:diacylglycerol O-acyltransferase